MTSHASSQSVALQRDSFNDIDVCLNEGQRNTKSTRLHSIQFDRAIFQILVSDRRHAINASLKKNDEKEEMDAY